MIPYYDDGQVTIYHGDCRDVLPLIAPGSVDLVLTDPPYGVNERTNRHSAGRGGGDAVNLTGGVAKSRDFPAVYGDTEPFDPLHLLRFKRLVLFGANYYAERLPASASWMIWDKLNSLASKRPIGFNDNADVELIWTNIGGPARIVTHRWMGLMKDSQFHEARVHPTEKPVALLEAMVNEWTHPNDLVLDPYIGSGSTLVAAQRLGRRAIGIEIEERYCETAVRRLQQMTIPLEMTA